MIESRVLLGRFEDGVGEAVGGAGGSFFLQAMMRLDNFNVIVIAKRPGDLGGDLEEQVNAEAHVRGLQDRDVLGSGVDPRVVGILQPGGADDQRNVLFAADVDPMGNGLGLRKIDHYLRPGRQFGRKGHADRSDQSDFPGIAIEFRIPARLRAATILSALSAFASAMRRMPMRPVAPVMATVVVAGFVMV